MKTIIHVVTIRTGRADPFRALTTQAGLSSWWSTDVTAEEQVGGVIRFRFLGDFNPEMAIVALQERSLVKWRCVSGHDNWRDNEFEFHLEGMSGGTRLKFTQAYSRELDDVQYGTYNFNWGYYLESLRLYCEEGKGRPFDPRKGRSG
jgi:uncharacterized protein YndB with AHSA1/START domain